MLTLTFLRLVAQGVREIFVDNDIEDLNNKFRSGLEMLQNPLVYSWEMITRDVAEITIIGDKKIYKNLVTGKIL